MNLHRKNRDSAYFSRKKIGAVPIFTLLIIALAGVCTGVAQAGDDALPIRCTVSEKGELEVWKAAGENIALGVGGVVVTRGTTLIEADRMGVWSGEGNHCYAEGHVVRKE